MVFSNKRMILLAAGLAFCVVPVSAEFTLEAFYAALKTYSCECCCWRADACARGRHVGGPLEFRACGVCESSATSGLDRTSN